MTLTEYESMFKPKKPYINLVIIGVNIIVFLICEVINASIVNGNNDIVTLYEKGMLIGSAVIDGELYRLVTYMFLHAGVDHIFNNMMILYFMGNYCERSFGSVGFTVLYFVSGIIAGTGSMIYNGPNAACVGASGAIFGIIGAVFCLILFSRKKNNIPIQQIILFIILSLYSGFTSKGVDNAAHITGFIIGFLICGLLTLLNREKTTPDIT